MTPTYEIDDADEPLPASGYRTYEVFQRERVGESTQLLSPRELAGDEMIGAPERLLGILREEYPCYRDWKGNRFWITRYDDVTSVFTDDANYQARSKRWSLSGGDLEVERNLGRNCWDHVPALTARAERIDAHLDDVLDRVLGDIATACRHDGAVDLATEFAARLPLELWGAVVGIDGENLAAFATAFWRMQLGTGWDPTRRQDGVAAFDELAALVAPLLERRRHEPDDDLVTAIAALDLGEQEPSARDVVATILEADHETLHGGLANLWFQLLRSDDGLGAVSAEPRLMKSAWLETLRHSPPVHHAHRFTRHEVERFGRLLPDGAMLHLSAAAANRDPRVFENPDDFVIDRKDLCQREPRGQYRADGLPSGITFGLGAPSIHPAVPKQRPRSIYAITRDVAVHASRRLLDEFPDIAVVADAAPTIRALRLGDMHTCWRLPVTSGA